MLYYIVTYNDNSLEIREFNPECDPVRKSFEIQYAILKDKRIKSYKKVSGKDVTRKDTEQLTKICERYLFGK